ncbi:hypothetical protein D8674_007197 [Pyrus ussuriensis x Pyrus communis]|uniref:Uncharacterized protein n=1 Tax=Pyrus ussuriensis x Pyrus communis TaxID=2448454 RepID=A0A5N5G1E2_9ROSA|nr:hypothetical protein D8674_007197 [Pyrus ussuriensis x Pyrus communis]
MNSVVNTDFDHCIKPFLLALIAKTIQLLKLLIISPASRDCDSNPDLEAAMQQIPNRRTNYKYLANNNLDWANIIVVFCLTAAIGLALLPLQIPSHQVLHSAIFYFLGLSVLLAFTCILVSKFIHVSYCPSGISIPHIFHHFGLFFGVTAFFISITIPFPLWFKCTTYSIYATAFLLVLLCNLHFNKYYKPHGFKYPTPNNSISKTAIDPAEESCQGGTSTVYNQGCTNIIV